MVSQNVVLTLLLTLVAIETSKVGPGLPLAFSVATVTGLCLLAVSMQLWSSKRQASLSGAGRQRPVLRIRADTSLLLSFLYPVAMLATGWIAWARQLEFHTHSSSIVFLTVFAPYVFIVLALAACDSYLEHRLLLGGVRADWPRLVISRLRFGEFSTVLLCLVPLLLFSGAYDLFLFIEGWKWPALFTAPLVLLALLVFLWCLPALAGVWLGAQAVQDRGLRCRLDELGAAASLKRVKALAVDSGGVWAGAAVIGWLPGSRQIWIGDGLLGMLTDRELDMVLLHEFAHIRGHHQLRRLAPIATSLLIAGLAMAAFNVAVSPPTSLAYIASVALSLMCLVVGIGAASRECEFDADKNACRLAEQICPWSQGQPRLAAEALRDALLKVENPGTAKSLGQQHWLYPSLRQRLSRLALVLSENQRG